MTGKRAASPKAGYHHGDLRNAVIDRSLKLLEEHGVDALSLRLLARELGVSQPAFYHHFADRNELLAALAAKGFERLATGLEKIPEGDGPAGKEALAHGIAALMQGYVRFALHRPHLFRVMFTHSVAMRPDSAELKRAAGESYGALSRQIASLLARSHVDSDAGQVTAMIWSLQHGIASLILNGGTSIEASLALAHVDHLIGNAAEVLAAGLVAARRDGSDRPV